MPSSNFTNPKIVLYADIPNFKEQFVIYNYLTFDSDLWAKELLAETIENSINGSENEPGVKFINNKGWGINPCVEIK